MGGLNLQIASVVWLFGLAYVVLSSNKSSFS